MVIKKGSRLPLVLAQLAASAAAAAAATSLTIAYSRFHKLTISPSKGSY